MNGVILFDGECNVCNKSVQFIIKRDPKGYYKFASQQSEAGMNLLKQYHIPKENDSLILIDHNRYYSHSTAALNIFKNLKGIWKFGYIFLLIPKGLRDYLYNIVANNRYKWFGKSEACLLPTPELQKRFL